VKHPVKQIQCSKRSRSRRHAGKHQDADADPTPASLLFPGGFCVGSTLTSDVILATCANPTWTRHGPFGCAGAEAREGNLPDRHLAVKAAWLLEGATGCQACRPSMSSVVVRDRRRAITQS
jgi:hypothetical protein